MKLISLRGTLAPLLLLLVCAVPSASAIAPPADITGLAWVGSYPSSGTVSASWTQDDTTDGYYYVVTESAAVPAADADWTYVPVAQPSMSESVAEGSWWVHVRSHYNYSPGGAVATIGSSVAVDRTAPTHTLDAPANNASVSTATTTVTFTANELVTFMCAPATIGQPAYACTSPQTITNTPGGPSSFSVYAVDVAGNRNGAISRMWTAPIPDTTPPNIDFGARVGQTTIVSGAAYKSDVASYYLNVFDEHTTGTPTTFSCTLDDVARACVIGNASIKDLKLGTHTFRIIATDPLGNSATKTLTWRVVPLSGTFRRDTLIAYRLGGIVHGLGGDDQLRGGAFRDTLYGDAGNDWMWGGLGNDVLHGGLGNDMMEGGKGKDTFYGGAGDDRIIATGDGRVREIINCGPGKDRAEVDPIDITIGCEIRLAGANW